MSVYNLSHGILPLEAPVPGYLHVWVHADGTISTQPATDPSFSTIIQGTEHDAPGCEAGKAAARPWAKLLWPWIQPVYHHSGCRACGHVIARTLEDITDWLEWSAENHILGFEHGPEGLPVANAVLAVNGTGWAGVGAPGAALRVGHVTFTGPAWLAQSTNGQPVPETLPGILADRYGLTVQWVPSIHELPGTAPRTPPVLGGEGYHPSGHYGRYGGVGVLLHHDGRFLLGKRSSNAKGGPDTWTPPGGNRTRHDSDPWQDALLELDEETGIRPNGATRHGSVTYQGESGWKFETFAASVDHHHEPTVNRHALADAGWFTAEEMQALPLMPEFAEVLPELLTIFEENNK